MDLLLLATEATEAAEGGGSGLSSVVVISLIVALAAFAVAYVVVGPGKRKAGAKRMGDIPLAMRPYHSDEELETTGLERAMAWGVALSLFSAVFVAAYWVIEPERINSRQDQFYPESTEQGRPGTPMPAWGAAYQGPLNDLQIQALVDYLLAIQTGEVEEADAQAFEGALGEGESIYQNNCARCHGDQLEGQVGPQLQNVFERYGWEEGDSEARAAVEETIRGTLQNGRYVPTGAIMPSFANVLTDDAMDAVIDYIFEQQVTGGPRYGQIGGDPVTDSGDADTESEG